MTKTTAPYLPSFTGPIEGYVTNFLRKHYWKVAAGMELEDAMQEARLVFLRCASKYGLTDTPQHFMALFKTAWHNHYIDLARGDSDARAVISYGYERDITSSVDDALLDLLDMIPACLDNDGYLNALLREAPNDVATILSFFLEAPPALIKRAGEAWTSSGRKQQDGNNMLCEVLGFPKGTDVVGKLTAYFLR